MRLTSTEKMVARLRTNLAEKETQVAALTTQVHTLENEVQVQAADIETKRRELGTIYYTIGTKKDLTDAGLVVAKGGVLGIGKTLDRGVESMKESAYGLESGAVQAANQEGEKAVDDLNAVEDYRAHENHRRYMDVFLRPMLAMIKVWNFELR